MIKPLTCCVCGNPTNGRQWAGRDTRYGLCDGCIPAATKGVPLDAVRQSYGVRGVHYDLTYTPDDGQKVRIAMNFRKGMLLFPAVPLPSCADDLKILTGATDPCEFIKANETLQRMAVYELHRELACDDQANQ